MNKLQEYLEKKRIATLELPKMWIVKSTRKGVELPIEVQVSKIKENNGSCSWYEGKNFVTKPITKYYLEDYLFDSVGIVEGKEYELQVGSGSGCGDLWEWSYYCTLSKELAFKYFEKELEIITDKYILNDKSEEFIPCSC
jgi:hypothetical protein